MSMSSRRSVVIAGGSTLAAWGLVFAATSRDDVEYDARKRRLFQALSADQIEGGLHVLEAIAVKDNRMQLSITHNARIGIGGNPTLGGFTNLEYYPRGTVLSGVDPALEDGAAGGIVRAAQCASAALAVTDAAVKAARLGIDLTAVGGRAEQLPIATASCDAVVSTLVFCSVQDPAQAMSEVARVLRPGGKWLFMEHVAAPRDGPLLASQRLLDPLQIAIASGCHLTRHTEELILSRTQQQQQQQQQRAPQLFSRVEGLERFTVGSRWPASTQIMGVAVK
ncbi:hypothetical protein JKP88DRAFT_307729 [Tribonema minus]|uniref:Methyltransferase type 11 domain-containing protein n=1 Tax=Tribonema minus TaxID=303371 RepID=A0A835Z8C0_9STRA|nr:hypothetical protein JKP88DRAFT_307729 [Tribonema minus]